MEDLVSRSEKIGVTFQARVSKEFHGLIEDMELMELPLQGRKLTWDNAVSTAKLDRFLLWEMKYTNAVVTALPRYGSDHVPLLLECETEEFKGCSSLKDHAFNKKTLFSQKKEFWSIGERVIEGAAL